LPKIKEWLKNNYADNIKSVSFLLHNEHGFSQAPYEEIDEETYNKMAENLTFVKVSTEGDDLEGIGCTGGACPIK